MPIRALVVDDEPLARKRLRNLLRDEPDVEVIAECGDGRQALAAIREHRPDLVFLDVQMPLLDGFGVLAELADEELPAVVFVTAFDHYALHAFEVHALDYLLKPFDRERFDKTLRRAREQLERKGDEAVSRRLQALLEDARRRPEEKPEVTGARRPVERLVIKSASRVVFVRLADIDWIEAAGNYLRLHVGAEVHLLRETMSGLEARLDPAQFVRIHRSTIVNLDRVRELQPAFHGDYVVILRNGTELTLSRGYRERLEERLGDRL